MIKLDHVQKVAGRNTVLAVEALSVQAGEVAAVVGPIDSGQAHLLALLTGQSPPTAGTVRVAGLDPASDRAQLSQQVGVLFSENALYDRLSARANLTFYCQLRGLPAGRADEVLLQVGLVDHAAVLAGRLPSGLARRLALGRAILHRPAVLILQEPLAGCDAASADLLARLIPQLAAQGTAVFLLVTDLAGLEGACQARYSIERGQVAPIAATPDQTGSREDRPFKVPARQEGQVALVNPADILYASAEGGRTYLHTTAGTIPTHLTLTELEPRLARRGFFRAHRSYLVNLQRVKAVVPYTRDSFTLVLDDPADTEIPLSKTAAGDLRELLDY